MSRVFISVAGNLAPEQNLLRGLALLREALPVAGVSRFFRTPALGRPGQPDYLNGVVEAATDLPARTLKFEVLRGIEARVGRVRTEDKWAPRPLDLDILLHGQLVAAEEDLVIPDPDLKERVFLAAGVLDLAPDIIPPGSDRPLQKFVDDASMAALQCDEAFTRLARERLAL